MAPHQLEFLECMLNPRHIIIAWRWGVKLPNLSEELPSKSLQMGTQPIFRIPGRFPNQFQSPGAHLPVGNGVER